MRNGPRGAFRLLCLVLGWYACRRLRAWSVGNPVPIALVIGSSFRAAGGNPAWVPRAAAGDTELDRRADPHRASRPHATGTVRRWRIPGHDLAPPRRVPTCCSEEACSPCRGCSIRLQPAQPGRPKDNPVLRAKVRRMKEFLADFCPQADARFWQQGRVLRREAEKTMPKD